MKETNSQRVAREDLALFINASFSCTGQSEFYGGAVGQRVSIEFLHQYILINYRRLYYRTLSVGINHFNSALVIVNLLSTGKQTQNSDGPEEGEILMAGLRGLPPQRVFRLIEVLKERRINNRRTRAIVREYIHGLQNLPFTALKYRRRFRCAARHAHLKLDNELGDILFDGVAGKAYETPLYESYRQAHYSQKAVYELPYTIAEGLAQKHKIPRDKFLKGIASKMTATERLRMQKSANKAGVSIDLQRTGLTALMLYILSLSVTERRERLQALLAAVEAAVQRSASMAPTVTGKVAAVLDRSFSSSGSSEKKRRPLAIALGIDALLHKVAYDYRAFWTPDISTINTLLVVPTGQTNIASPLLDALEWGAKTVVIVSDGYENDVPRATERLLCAYRKNMDPNREVSIVHLNPVFESEMFQPRELSPLLVTLGLHKAEDLFIQLSFAKFAEGSAPLKELEFFLEEMAQNFIEKDRKHRT